ncbi:hypothetical protein IMG5_175990 [Ichthyophthirius multifiliis]|uniref:Arrestin C-terminal-like domain-containing protein n=1 Tax=Ichthyophthirius multifiliis TaxID=5932 RepID=G0R288_ICHMU|nr:hypothetical protein IMG5_175990 [Ichthyophthirius multifiliis]EGR28413.1 hypothetical protein IMG5_175990 [Ichthyophthirius multifiliis]|eukprot:XP_004029649.1 hypothetical protein IMG5_175990 [Ichthyophthirius multifiliis]
MGNCNSAENQQKDKYGQLEVNIEKNKVQKGEIISGRLKLNLNQDYPGLQLSIRFRGIESIRKGTAQYAENEVYGETIKLIPVNTIKAGEHLYFFEFEIPQNLKAQHSSVIINEKEQKFAVSMVYQIKAILEPIELLSEEVQKIEGSAIFQLQADFYEEGKSCNSKGILKNQQGKEYGNVNIFLKSDKYGYESGDNTIIDINVDNKEVKMPLKSLKCIFLREIQFLGKCKNKFLRNQIKEFDKQTLISKINEQIVSFDNQNLDLINTQVQFIMPQNMVQSFYGKQFNCKYYFDLFAHYEENQQNYIDAKARLLINIIPINIRCIPLSHDEMLKKQSYQNQKNIPNSYLYSSLVKQSKIENKEIQFQATPIY